MKDINRRLERLEQAVKARPVKLDAALVRVQEAIEGLEGEHRVLTAMGTANQIAPEVFMAWTQSLPDDERQFAWDVIKQLAEIVRASYEGQEMTEDQLKCSHDFFNRVERSTQASRKAE